MEYVTFYSYSERTSHAARPTELQIMGYLQVATKYKSRSICRRNNISPTEVSREDHSVCLVQLIEPHMVRPDSVTERYFHRAFVVSSDGTLAA